jgi:transcriptional regulator with XRE-family HTH domain
MDYALKAILQLIEEKYKKDSDFEAAFGLAKSTVSAWRRGKLKSYQSKIAEIADFFQVPVQYFYEDKKTSSPSEEDELTAEAIRLFKMLPDDKKRAFLALMDDFGKK